MPKSCEISAFYGVLHIFPFHFLHTVPGKGYSMPNSYHQEEESDGGKHELDFTESRTLILRDGGFEEHQIIGFMIKNVYIRRPLYIQVYNHLSI